MKALRFAEGGYLAGGRSDGRIGAAREDIGALRQAAAPPHYLCAGNSSCRRRERTEQGMMREGRWGSPASSSMRCSKAAAAAAWRLPLRRACELREALT